MSFTTICPNCAARLTAPDTVRGKRWKCKKCGDPFTARQAIEDDDLPRKSAKARRPADDDDDDDGPVRRRRDEEDDEPRPSARRKRKKKKKPAGPPVLLFVLIGVGAVVLLGGGIGAYLMFGKVSKPANGMVPFGDEFDRPAGTATAINWVSYTAPDGTFTGKFPQYPEHTTPTVQSPTGPVQTNLYSVDTPMVSAMVVTAEIPGVGPNQPLDPQLANRAVEAACDTLTQRYQNGGKQVSRTNMTHQGRTGRELTITAADGSGGKARIFIDQGRVWTLLFINKRARPDAGTLSAFFDGIKLQ